MAKEFDSETVQLATRIPKHLHVRVRVRAIDEGVTLAEWLVDALTTHLEACRRAARKTARKEGSEGAA
jgi:predicted HicB family RNase H-like nuclease